MKPHLMSLQRLMYSRAFMPAASAATPCVLPLQPPSKRTERIVSPSRSMWIPLEQTPRGVKSYLIVYLPFYSANNLSNSACDVVNVPTGFFRVV